jgi:hypothetical protein
LKILFLSFYFPPDLSAGSFRAKAIADALIKLDPTLEIEIITTLPNRYESFRKGALDVEKLKQCTIRRIDLPSHKSGIFDQSKAFLKYFKHVLKFTKKSDYDLVYATSSRLMTALLGAYISNKMRKPLYLDIRDIFTDTMKDILSPKISFIINPILNIIEQWTISKADHVNLVSEGFKQYFYDKYSDVNYSFFTNGIDEAFLINKKNFVNRQNPVKTIVYAGNIGEGQGLHEFLPLLAEKTQKHTRYKIIGDGGKRNILERNLSLRNITNVELVDPVERSELLIEYQKADILFLHLNNYNAFKKVLPSKVFEYAAMEKPILAGVSGYSATFLNTHVENSAVFEPCNLQQAVKSLEQLEMGQTDRTEFINSFLRTKIMLEMAKSILSACSKKVPF